MRFAIGKKIFTGFLSAAVLLGAASGISFYYMNKVNDSYSDLINRQVTILTATKDIQVLALQQTNGLRGYLLTQNPDFIHELETANEQLNVRIEQTGSLVTQPESKDSVQKLTRLNRQFKENYDQLLASYAQDRNQEEALNTFKTKVLPVGIQLGPLAKSIMDRQQQLLNQGTKLNTEMVNQANKAVSLLSMLTFALTLLIGFVITRHITGNLFKITKVMAGVTSDSSSRTRLPRIDVRTRDEIGDIAYSFNEMAIALENYSAHEQEKSMLETNIAEMATMYQGIHDLNTLAQLFITKITPMTGASCGVFYLKQGAGDRQRLHRLAGYADNRQEIGFESFLYGEGLVGQCAFENRTIMLTDIPEHYIQIISGTGKASPSNLIIMPVEYEGHVVAVIELASFTKFSKAQQTLLQQVLNHAGITINSIAGRMQVERLLQESQALTEELQNQSEELRLQQEELRRINGQLEEQYKKSEQKTKEIEITKMELVEKADQLALSSRYKSEFLANMSHELRTPLNSLLILSNLLAENSEGNLTENQVKFAQTIHSSGNDLLHLINDILDLSKVESGKIEIVPDEVSLTYICQFAELEFLQAAQQKGLKFTTELDAGLPPTICTDTHRLMQILRNLLANAFKFTEHGEVAFRIHKADNQIFSDYRGRINLEAAVAFSISDTGIGIPEEKLSLVFQAFQQEDGTTSRKYGGTGLGLSISRELAHLLDGFIEVSSDKGKGSTFTLLLPGYGGSTAAEPPMNNDEAAIVHVEFEEKEWQAPVIHHEDIFFAGKKVLIVDDDMRNIFAITAALENKQMKVVFAENGREGIRVLQDNPDIDLILMDIMLPEMDGYEAMRIVRQMPEFHYLPIIALTAKAMKDDKEKCMEAGASDYISKPVSLEQLFSLMQVWLYRQAGSYA
ncbi:response regulator [Paenibacillus sp. Soil522]|uniref:response regulator n=1 Tax=Paenibacillus sp. Soil522 TaxID=1736388 RepID=UPI0006F3E3BC|nr:response regulator [Paenibacillus sp. Soil522]KRE48993.1 hypothetical protein ASG81_05505 [Paenibacillus sp. Soil522]